MVGDDDQALYRFRGATVENFVQFPERCTAYLSQTPRRIELNTNYRSRREIVEFYTGFMEQYNWENPQGGHYRLQGKGIRAFSQDPRAAVVASSQLKGDEVADEVAGLVKRLIDEGKVKDPNQVAFLFPSLKAVAAKRMHRRARAARPQGLRPAGEAFFGGGRTQRRRGLVHPSCSVNLAAEQLYNLGDYKEYHDWLSACEARAKALCDDDANLKRYLADRREDLKQILADHDVLSRVMSEQGWGRSDIYYPERHKRVLASAKGLSAKARGGLGGKYLDAIAEKRLDEGEPFSLAYILNRATSVDWNLLDLFYRFCGFDHLKAMFDLAEIGEDEGPHLQPELDQPITSPASSTSIRASSRPTLSGTTSSRTPFSAPSCSRSSASARANLKTPKTPSPRAASLFSPFTRAKA